MVSKQQDIKKSMLKNNLNLQESDCSFEKIREIQ